MGYHPVHYDGRFLRLIKHILTAPTEWTACCAPEVGAMFPAIRLEGIFGIFDGNASYILGKHRDCTLRVKTNVFLLQRP